MIRATAHFGGNIVLFCLGLFGGAWIITNTAPAEARNWQFVFLYFSIFLVVFSLSFLFGYGLRKILWTKTFLSGAWSAARRQGFLLGLLTVLALILRAADLLNYKTVIPLILIFLILELYGQ